MFRCSSKSLGRTVAFGSTKYVIRVDFLNIAAGKTAIVAAMWIPFFFFLISLGPWANAYFMSEARRSWKYKWVTLFLTLSLKTKVLKSRLPGYLDPRIFRLLADLKHIAMATCQSLSYLHAQSCESSAMLMF